MAETDAAAEAGGSIMDKLGHKVGPLPVGAWIILAISMWWYMKKRSGAAGTGAQTDPAGNTGTINPRTGYVYGSPEDLAAQSQNTAGTGLGTDSGTSGGSTVAGTYADNTAWANAAINYLVSIGEDAVASNSAITQYLASQPLTQQQQSLVNLAVQRLGGPPSPPQPGTAPPPIVSPPSPGQVYATNPPTGLVVAPAGSTSLTVKWNRSSNAQGYTVRWGTTAAASGGSTTVSGTAGTTTITGLKPNTRYYVQVQATPAKQGDPFATASATTQKGSPGGGGGGGTKSGGGSPPRSVRAGENGEPGTFSGIAAKWHVPGGARALYQYQLTTPFHTAAAKKEIKDRGPNRVVVGEQIFLPEGSHA
jgi:hypothetical protein